MAPTNLLTAPAAINKLSPSYASRGPTRPARRRPLRMTTTQTHEVTRLLLDWRNGDEAALERLTPLVYAELRRLARRYMRGEREGHTLDGTALVTLRTSARRRRWPRLANRALYGVARAADAGDIVEHSRRPTPTRRRAARPPCRSKVGLSSRARRRLFALDEARKHSPGSTAQECLVELVTSAASIEEM